MTITSMMMIDSDDDEYEHDDEVGSTIMMPISPPSNPPLQHDSRNKLSLDDGCECPMVVTLTMKDAAKQILKHSFAIYSTKSSTTTTTTATATNINVAWKAAKEMFSAIDRKDGASNAPKRIIHQGHLHGFNEPSRAKYLYRAFCNSSIQPWPS